VLDISDVRSCVIAGTVYKEMKLKPCILDEYTKTAGGAPGVAATRYMSPDDSLILEDEYGRVGLTGAADKLPVRSMVSGMVVAVLGREVAGGKFEVEAVFSPGMAPQQPLPRSLLSSAGAASDAAARAPAYMLVVSGLGLGTPGLDHTPVQLLMDYITGLLCSGDEQSARSARIVRVVVAGNSLHRMEKKKTTTGTRNEDVEAQEMVGPLKELDVLLTQLSAAVHVHLCPGESDPSNFTLPQQPLHKCLLPWSTRARVHFEHCSDVRVH
jgi:DNA polymerase delta subunit 2